MGLDAIVSAIASEAAAQVERTKADAEVRVAEILEDAGARAEVERIAGRRNATPKPNGPWHGSTIERVSTPTDTWHRHGRISSRKHSTRLRSRPRGHGRRPRLREDPGGALQGGAHHLPGGRGHGLGPSVPIRNGSSESSPNTDATIEYQEASNASGASTSKPATAGRLAIPSTRD